VALITSTVPDATFQFRLSTVAITLFVDAERTFAFSVDRARKKTLGTGTAPPGARDGALPICRKPNNCQKPKETPVTTTPMATYGLAAQLGGKK
jgi:hypothetical protein